MMLESL